MKEIFLKTDKAEFEKKIIDRISKGEEMATRRISGKGDLDELKNEFYKWDQYNERLLLCSFSGDELLKNYKEEPLIVPGGSMIQDFFKKAVKDFFDRLNRKCLKLEAILDQLDLIHYDGTKRQLDFDPNKIFLVHGRDDQFLKAVVDVINDIGMKPIVIREQPNQGATIIEKIEGNANVALGLILYSPCDRGRLNQSESEESPRARQNVIFEHGFIMGKIGRDRTIMIVKGEVEIPSDLAGVVQVRVNDSSWEEELKKEIRESIHRLANTSR